MVALVRQGAGLRAVARRFQVSPATVRLWVERAAGQRLERVEWADRPSRPHRQARQTPAALEEQIVGLRQVLKEQSILGEFGAAAIQRALVAHGHRAVPSVRTIGRILERRGLLDGRRRLRRPPPPAGWYLPDLAARRVELDSLDVVEDLKIKEGPLVDVLTAISLHGGLTAAWPRESIPASFVTEALTAHWQAVGLPAYAQFDNDTRFQGPHQHADVVGRVMRLCLSLGVTPVFAPPRESGFQAAIESFNGRWQQKVWQRFTHPSLGALQERSDAYIAASHARAASRIEAAPARLPIPAGWRLDLQAPPRGRIIFLRRTSDSGTVSLLGRSFPVAPAWSRRLVRSEVDLEAGVIRFFALRRREPTHQPLLQTLPYHLPYRRFRE